MERIILKRMIRREGILEGALMVDGIRECHVMEREAGALAPGEYGVGLKKCPLRKRLMPFVGEPPTEQVCSECQTLQKSRHREVFADRSQPMTVIPCAMITDGNGVMNLPAGTMVVGRPHCRGLLLESRPTFLRLYDALRKTLQRGGEVKMAVTAIPYTFCGTENR